MTARAITAPRSTRSDRGPHLWVARAESVAGSRRAATGLAMGVRARGLRGMDVLRRSRDRAPPAFS